jgi:hypothetical protein
MPLQAMHVSSLLVSTRVSALRRAVSVEQFAGALHVCRWTVQLLLGSYVDLTRLCQVQSSM